MNRFRFSEKLINQRKEVKMKIENNVLVGLWFLTHDSEGNKEFQGQILSKLENNIIHIKNAEDYHKLVYELDGRPYDVVVLFNLQPEE